MSENTFFKAPRYLLRKHNVINLINGRSDVRSVLDVGCGAGELTCTLAQHGYKTTGIDFADEAIAVANSIKKHRGIKDANLDFILGGLEDVSKRKFDLIVCCEVLEHIKDDNEFLKRIKAADSKYVIISTPARQKWFDHFDEKVGHYRRYEKKELTEQLETQGFEIIDFRSYGYPYINLTRLMRKAMAGRVKEQSSIKERTKESGINPIKVGFLKKIDIEPITRVLYWTTKPFNRFNLSEGYVVLCKNKSA